MAEDDIEHIVNCLEAGVNASSRGHPKNMKIA
jgi:hypothetical protein